MELLFDKVVKYSKNRNTAKGKICSKCNKFKALIFFSVDNGTKDKLRSSCKSCDSVVQSKSRKNIDYINVTDKQCSVCGRVLSIKFFGLDKTKKDKHRSYCLECMREQAKHRRRIKLVKQPTSKL